MTRFDDGRTMVYGAMGGEGQPQTQAAVFSRYGLFNQPLQQAVTAPRSALKSNPLSDGPAPRPSPFFILVCRPRAARVYIQGTVHHRETFIVLNKYLTPC